MASINLTSPDVFEFHMLEIRLRNFKYDRSKIIKELQELKKKVTKNCRYIGAIFAIGVHSSRLYWKEKEHRELLMTGLAALIFSSVMLYLYFKNVGSKIDSVEIKKKNVLSGIVGAANDLDRFISQRLNAAADERLLIAAADERLNAAADERLNAAADERLNAAPDSVPLMKLNSSDLTEINHLKIIDMQKKKKNIIKRGVISFSAVVLPMIAFGKLLEHYME